MAEITEGYMPYLGYETYWRVVGSLDEARERGMAPLVAKTMYDAIPRSRWELMAGARHMCFVDAHDAYVALVRNWCAECD